MFTHKPVELPELSTKNVNRKRFYLTPEGKLYPSITTVLQRRKMQGLMEWRKRVGEDVANYVARTAAHRGTKVHHMCEDFLNNNFDDEVHKKNFLPYVLFGQIKPVLMQKVNNIFAQECGLYSDKCRNVINKSIFRVIKYIFFSFEELVIITKNPGSKYKSL